MNAQTKIVARRPSAGEAAVRYRLRVDDYILLHEQGSFQGTQTELVDGDIYIMSPEWRPRYRIKSELIHRLHDAVRKADLPFFVGTEGSIALSDTDMPRPDISLTSEPDGEGAIPAASVPLAVEISSTTLGMDLGPKAARYAQGGLAEYWEVDVNGRIVHRFSSPSADGYAQHEEIAFDEPLSSVTMAGLKIATAGL